MSLRELLRDAGRALERGIGDAGKALDEFLTGEDLDPHHHHHHHRASAADERDFRERFPALSTGLDPLVFACAAKLVNGVAGNPPLSGTLYVTAERICFFAWTARVCRCHASVHTNTTAQPQRPPAAQTQQEGISADPVATPAPNEGAKTDVPSQEASSSSAEATPTSSPAAASGAPAASVVCTCGAAAQQGGFLGEVDSALAELGLGQSQDAVAVTIPTPTIEHVGQAVSLPAQTGGFVIAPLENLPQGAAADVLQIYTKERLVHTIYGLGHRYRSALNAIAWAHGQKTAPNTAGTQSGTPGDQAEGAATATTTATVAVPEAVPEPVVEVDAVAVALPDDDNSAKTP
jgi:hypothetical protein